MKKIMFNDKYGLTQAVLDGRKTMTRRIANLTQQEADMLMGKLPDCPKSLICAIWHNKSRFKVGEVVAIAQSYMDVDRFHRKGKNAAYLEYLDSILPELKLYPGWGNKMFVKASLMPHHIKITDIKVERLQDISDGDCLKEGIIHTSTFLGQKIYHTPHVNGAYLSTNVAQEAFAFLIDKVSGKGVWESNPFVFAYEFVLFD